MSSVASSPAAPGSARAVATGSAVSLAEPSTVALHVAPPVELQATVPDVYVLFTPAGLQFVEHTTDGDVSPVQAVDDLDLDISEAEFLARLLTPLFCGTVSVVPRSTIPTPS